MDTSIKALKRRAFSEILRQLTSEQGMLVEWDEYEDADGEDSWIRRVEHVGPYSVGTHGVCLPDSFHAGISSPGTALYYAGLVPLAAELAKRKVRTFLAELGYDPKRVTREWYR